MRIVVTQGGHPEFRVQHVNREDLVISSSLTGVQAVEKVAEWLAEVPVPAVLAEANVRKVPRSIPPKEAP